MTRYSNPLPLFDSLEHISEVEKNVAKHISKHADYKISLNFLKSYVGSKGTFNAYRREIERLLLL